jgi:hypothetical protein
MLLVVFCTLEILKVLVSLEALEEYDLLFLELYVVIGKEETVS